MSLLDNIPRRQRSILQNTVAREHGLCGRLKFQREISRFFHTKHLLQDPDIVSPHRKSISSMSMDATGRFLLAGSSDATVSIYDISKWGRAVATNQSSSLNTTENHSYSPVAKSVKVPFVSDVLRLPLGHSSSITYTQWYPTDAGVFFSASSDGTILVWDTHKMKPVLRVFPFQDESAAWISAHLREGGDHSLMAAGSWYESEIKLVDVRSGAASHQLVGHEDGISTLKWSKNNPNIVASGSRDSTVRLWDIRKSGSQACVTILDREDDVSCSGRTSWGRRSTNVGYASDYSHLRKVPNERRNLSPYLRTSASKRQRPNKEVAVAPNNYDHVQHQGSRSHNGGHVSGLSFFGSGHFLCSVCGIDGELLLWDLKTGCLLPSKFTAPGNLSAGAPKQRKTPILAEGSGYTDSCNKTGTIWLGRKGFLYGYSTNGGTPKQRLTGHLTNITSLTSMEPGGKLFTGSADGMILAWGQAHQDGRLGQASISHTYANTTIEDKDNW